MSSTGEKAISGRWKIIYGEARAMEEKPADEKENGNDSSDDSVDELSDIF